MAKAHGNRVYARLLWYGIISGFQKKKYLLGSLLTGAIAHAPWRWDGQTDYQDDLLFYVIRTYTWEDVYLSNDGH